MFCADASIQAVKVMGPPGITHYLASMRSYCKRFVDIACSHIIID